MGFVSKIKKDQHRYKFKNYGTYIKEVKNVIIKLRFRVDMIQDLLELSDGILYISSFLRIIRCSSHQEVFNAKRFHK